MHILNFSHPLTDAQLEQIISMIGSKPIQVVDIKTHFDEQQSFREQAKALLEGIMLTANEWQSEPILVVLPSLNFITAVLLAELHGRMGYFPPMVRTKPIPDSMPRQFEIAEIIDLQSVRDLARQSR